MQENIIITNGSNDEPKEVIIKIDISEVFHKRECHPEDVDPGTVIYYIIQVDKKQLEVKQPEMAGRQILALVELTPDKYRLFELGEGQREILPDEIVDFRKCGIERFKSVARHANEGNEATAGVASLSAIRREFHLLLEDQKYLNRISDCWETIMSGNTGWILITDYKLPDGYNVKDTTIAFMLPSSYPTVEFDMMYFFPALSRADGKPIGALSSHVLDGKNFQRWSRHRNSGDWRSDIDNLESHVLSVQGWLNDELLKR